jgi:peptidoglycan hydrolase-like protein with peptidoglycan-binding domain
MLPSTDLEQYGSGVGRAQSFGPDVENLQLFLSRMGYLSKDAILGWKNGNKGVSPYGEKTSAAVSDFQKRHKFTVDGKYQGITKEALQVLEKTLTRDDSMSTNGVAATIVETLQRRLAEIDSGNYKFLAAGKQSFTWPTATGVVTDNLDFNGKWGRFGKTTSAYLSHFQNKKGISRQFLGIYGPDTYRIVFSVSDTMQGLPVKPKPATSSAAASAGSGNFYIRQWFPATGVMKAGLDTEDTNDDITLHSTECGPASMAMCFRALGILSGTSKADPNSIALFRKSIVTYVAGLPKKQRDRIDAYFLTDSTSLIVAAQNVATNNGLVITGPKKTFLVESASGFSSMTDDLANDWKIVLLGGYRFRRAPLKMSAYTKSMNSLVGADNTAGSERMSAPGGIGHWIAVVGNSGGTAGTFLVGDPAYKSGGAIVTTSRDLLDTFIAEGKNYNATSGSYVRVKKVIG